MDNNEPMTYEQFKQTEFYKETFKHYLTRFNEVFTIECLESVYWRFYFAGLLVNNEHLN